MPPLASIPSRRSSSSVLPHPSLHTHVSGRAACRVSALDSGKPMVDAAFGEVMVTCEKAAWLLREGERWLRPESRSAGRMVSPAGLRRWRPALRLDVPEHPDCRRQAPSPSCPPSSRCGHLLWQDLPLQSRLCLQPPAHADVLQVGLGGVPSCRGGAPRWTHRHVSCACTAWPHSLLQLLWCAVSTRKPEARGAAGGGHRAVQLPLPQHLQPPVGSSLRRQRSGHQGVSTLRSALAQRLTCHVARTPQHLLTEAPAQVSEHASWSALQYGPIIDAALHAAGALPCRGGPQHGVRAQASLVRPAGQACAA